MKPKEVEEAVPEEAPMMEEPNQQEQML